MVASLFLFATAALSITATSFTEEQLFSSLLKRQEPGTPAYECHSNCGNAVSLSKGGGDFCNNDEFIRDYNACLECAGPDNINIWRYYGRSLSVAGEKCGLGTTPLPGKQPDGPASGTESSSTLPLTSLAPTTSPIGSPPSMPTSSTSAAVGDPAPTSGTLSETTSYPVQISSNNGTATSTASPPAEFTGAAPHYGFSNAAVVAGVVVVGAIYGA